MAHDAWDTGAGQGLAMVGGMAPGVKLADAPPSGRPRPPAVGRRRDDRKTSDAAQACS